MGPIKIHNGENYAHAQDSNAYNFSYYLHNNYLRIVLKSIQKFDSHVKFFLLVVSFKPFKLLVFFDLVAFR